MNRRQVLAGGAAATFVTAGTAGAADWSRGSSRDDDAAVAATRTGLRATPASIGLNRFATPAASGHNTEPWRFRVDGDSMMILPDLTRRTPVVDREDHHLFAGLGCATENLAIVAGGRDRPGEIEFLGNDGGAIAFFHRRLEHRYLRRCSTRSRAANRHAPTTMDARSPLQTCARWRPPR